MTRMIGAVMMGLHVCRFYELQRKVPRFYPTKLAINFYDSNRRVTLDTDKHKTGFIFVETNYRLYAYTHSGKN